MFILTYWYGQSNDSNLQKNGEKSLEKIIFTFFSPVTKI